MGQRRQDGPRVRNPGVLGREELDDVCAGFGRLEDLGGGERPADRRDLVAVGDSNHLGVELGTHQERGACADALVGGVTVQDRPGSDDDPLRVVAGRQPVDEVDGAGSGRGDLERSEPAVDRCMSHTLRSVGVWQPDDQDRPGFLDGAQGAELGVHGFLAIGD